jgi:hypothetical protein
VEADFNAGASNAWPKLLTETAPTGTDCDAAAEYGRLLFDDDLDTNGSVMVCTSAGWKDIDDDGAAGGTPGGTAGDVQYNDGASGFAGEAAFDYNDGTNLLTVDNITSTGTWTNTGQVDLDTSEILSATALRFEGATDNNIYLQIAITDPTTSSKTATFQDATGVVAINANAINDFETGVLAVAAGALDVGGDTLTATHIDETGAFAFSSTSNTFVGSDFTTTTIGKFQWTSQSEISSPADSQIMFTNAAATDFSRLLLGGTTSSFPALGRSGASLQAILADGSSSAGMIAASYTDGSGAPAGSGVLRCANNVACMAAEAAPAGTDRTFILDASEIWQLNAPIAITEAGNVIVDATSSDNNAVQLTLTTNSTNRRIVGYNAAVAIQSQLSLEDSSIRLLGPTGGDLYFTADANGIIVPLNAGAAPTASGVIVYDSTANALEYGDNGTNRTVANLDEAQTLASKTLTTPTIGDFTNATHNHTNAAGGGTLTLAGAAFANQGTTTTVLHGNAAGNPSWAQVNLTSTVTGVLPEANLPDMSATAQGVAEAAIASEMDTGTSTTLAATPDALAGSNFGERIVMVELFEAATDNTTGVGKVYFHISSTLTGMDLVEVNLHVVQTGTTGTLNVDLHKCDPVATGNQCTGTVGDMLSTNVTVDSGENKSATAAASYAIDSAQDDVTTDDVIRIDVDAIHSGTAAKGGILSMTFRLP